MKRRKAQDTVRGTWALRARGRAKKTNGDRQGKNKARDRLWGRKTIRKGERMTDKQKQNRLTERQTDRDRRRQCIRSKDKK